MFAVVTGFDRSPHGRKYSLEFCDPVCRVAVGGRVSARRLRRLLEPFHGNFLLASDVKPHGLKGFDTSELQERLLFRQFCEHVLSLPGISLSVGVFDPTGKLLDHDLLNSVIAHAAATTVFTFRDAEQHCRDWLMTTGTCPEIVERKAWLFGCDCLFAPQGLAGFEGTLFGSGGKGIDPRALHFKSEHRALLSHSVDPIDLACMLERESTAADAEQAYERV